MTENKPRIWSDFDGTAVAKAYLLDPRNLTKYPLPEMEGYADFLRGAQLKDDIDGAQDRIEIAGIVTKRPDIFIRRMVTARSVAKLGLKEFFPDHSQLIHTGHERLKATHLIHESETARIGMIEDRPQKLGAEILKIMAAQSTNEEVERLIVLGVVSGDKSAAYNDTLVNNAKSLYGDAEISEFDYRADDNLMNIGHRIRFGKSVLEVVPLAQYSQSSGAHFSRHLLGPGPVEAEPEPASLFSKVTFFVKTVGQEGLELIKKGRDRARFAGHRVAKFPRTIVIETLSGVKHVTIGPGHMSDGTEVSAESVPPSDK